MGKQQSKTTDITGDAHVNVINELAAVNNDRHSDHELKLWVLIALNVLQILYKIYKCHQKRLTRRAFAKGCKSQNAKNSEISETTVRSVNQ